jgi:hypothetical protein
MVSSLEGGLRRVTNINLTRKNENNVIKVINRFPLRQLKEEV